MKTILFMFALSSHLAIGINPHHSPKSFMYGTHGTVVTLQAKVGGGLRASIPDFCGVEEMYFYWWKDLKHPESGGVVKSKTEGSWIFEDPQLQLAPGETIIYSCAIKYRGEYFAKANKKWKVRRLVDEFEPAKPPKNQENCTLDQTSSTSDNKTSLLPVDGPAKQTNSSNGLSELKPHDEMQEESKKLKIQEAKNNPNHKSRLKASNDPIFECGTQKVQPDQPYEKQLETQLVNVQCENMRLAEQIFLDKKALSIELFEILKLHDALSKRIENLKMFINPEPVP